MSADRKNTSSFEFTLNLLIAGLIRNHPVLRRQNYLQPNHKIPYPGEKKYKILFHIPPQASLSQAEVSQPIELLLAQKQFPIISLLYLS